MAFLGKKFAYVVKDMAFLGKKFAYVVKDMAFHGKKFAYQAGKQDNYAVGSVDDACALP